MNRYKKANEGIHAPEEVKENAARPAGKRTYTRWIGAAAAVLAAAVIGGAAMRSGLFGAPTADNPGEPMPYSEAETVQPRTVSDVGSAEGSSSAGVPAYGGGSHNALALSEAVYQLPETEVPPMPNLSDFLPDDKDSEDAWKQADDAFWEAIQAWQKIAYAAQYKLAENETIGGFITASTTRFLTGAGEDNQVYSPLNLYMALAMLAETSGGESRRQILDVLGADSIETLREDAAAVWQNYYQDSNWGISVMANSLWLRDGMTYSQDTLDTLAANYYASSFSGEMGAEAYNQALRDWISEQTRGLLDEQTNGLTLDPETVLALVSTIYFQAAWSSEFQKSDTELGIFHAPSGDMTTDFMHQAMDSDYYWGEHFSAIRLEFQASNYHMCLILPDEGYTVNDLLDSGEAMEFLLADKDGVYDKEANDFVGAWPDRAFRQINLSLPKFDVSSDLDLTGGLKALGITDVFDYTVSNFDPLGASTDDLLFVSTVQHTARVKVDEEGCEAAAVTVVKYGPAAAPPPNEVVDFTLDRPFLFAITGNSDLPLFLGVVNQPHG